MGFLKTVFGSRNEREVKRMKPMISAINALEPKYEAMDDETLKDQTRLLKEELSKGKTLNQILPYAFAVVREGAKRVLGMRHYDVQMVGGIVLHQGRIAEMKTGEGKTLVATLAVYLNALAGKGVHVVTVNDYLAKRDAEWMGQLYHFLGLTVGIIIHGIEDDERQENYGCDITYGTNNEFGFDYLRDNMKYDINDYVQRKPFYCIVDEVDSILIDEARTPLIISGPTESSVDKYYVVDEVVRHLKEIDHYTIDIKDKLALLNEAGVDVVEKRLNIKNLYDPANIDLMDHVQQGLKAHAIFKEGTDYVVQGGKVVIVDEFTGRLMDGRRWSDGLHQAVEAKEAIDTPIRVRKLLAQGVLLEPEDQVPPEVENENQTLATITFQNYFRMYEKLSGMTGTADTEAKEFAKIYKLEVIVIPTNRPIDRKDREDLIYRDQEEKMDAIIEEIKRVSLKKQPVLVGTISIEQSERISFFLQKAGVKHHVLNAKNHRGEASIVAQAGRLGAVTVATNMAGRGTDIVLGGNAESLAREELTNLAEQPIEEAYDTVFKEIVVKYQEICQREKAEVLKAGGLYILGTERHESRRIDNQLRGRSGRQGDPGESCFFISLQDDLMKRFGGDRIGNMMERLGYKRGEPITHKLISKSIENAQKKVEAIHFDIRKNILEYDDVMNKQRETIYTLRRRLLDGENLKDIIFDILEEITVMIVDRVITDPNRPDEWNLRYAVEKSKEVFDLDIEDILSNRPNDREAIENQIYFAAEKRYNEKEEELGEENARQIERYFYLQSLDHLWKEHLLTMDLIRESIGLRGYAQKDPKIEYKREGYAAFVSMLLRIKVDFIKKLLRVQLDEEYAASEEELDLMDEMNRRLESLQGMGTQGQDAERDALMNEMNSRLTGFSFEKEKQEYQDMMNRMQYGNEDSESGDSAAQTPVKSKKKKERKFQQVSAKKRKKQQKKKK